jgi:regulator of RNase E activity RraB
MKTYTTVEMIQALMEHPEWEFETEWLKRERPVINSDGDILWKDTQSSVCLDATFMNQQWTLVEKPVTFIEAVNSGKCVRYEGWDTYIKLDEALYEICANQCANEVRKAINGKWYVEG